MINDIRKDAEERMKKSVAALASQLSKIRTGRAHPALLDGITVSYYGADTPLNQVANVTTEDSRTLAISVFDKSLAQAVEKAIMSSDLGLNPTVNGQLIRVPIPDLTEERRVELSKVASQFAENARISIRNIRREAMDTIKKEKKNNKISEDERTNLSDSIQKLTDEKIVEIDVKYKNKEKEVLQI